MTRRILVIHTVNMTDINVVIAANRRLVAVNLFGSGGEIERLLGLFDPGAFYRFGPVRAPVLGHILMRSLGQLVSGFQERHISGCPDGRRRIGTNADSIGSGSGCQLNIVTGQQEDNLAIGQPGGYDLDHGEHVGVLARRRGLVNHGDPGWRMLVIQSRDLAKRRSWTTVIVLVPGGAAVWPGHRRRGLHYVRHLGFYQTGVENRGTRIAAVRSRCCVPVVMVVKPGRTRSTCYAVCHAARTAPETTIRSGSKVQVQLGDTAVQVTQQPLFDRWVHRCCVASYYVRSIQITTHLCAFKLTFSYT